MEKLVGYLVCAALLGGALFGVNETLKSHYQAEIKKDLEAAEGDRDKYKANAEAEAENAKKLNALLVKQAAKDRGIDAKIGELNDAIKNLNSPEAIAQRDLRLHSELVRESAYGNSTNSVQGPNISPAAGGNSEGRAGGVDSGRPAQPEKQTIRPTGEGQQPTDGGTESVSRWQKLKDLFK